MSLPPFDLRKERLNRGLTQRALALETGVPYTTIQRLEANLGVRPANAKRIADYFKVQVTDLMPVERAA